MADIRRTPEEDVLTVLEDQIREFNNWIDTQEKDAKSAAEALKDATDAAKFAKSVRDHLLQIRDSWAKEHGLDD